MRGRVQRIPGRAALLVALVLPAPALAATHAGAKALESRLYAPCCYNGTLDAHESDVARTLRVEIESRLANGESGEAIQSDFVARYGERVLAARSDTWIRAMGLAVGLSTLAVAIALVLTVRRWSSRRSPADGVVRPARDALDARIDAELARLDERG